VDVHRSLGSAAGRPRKIPSVGAGTRGVCAATDTSALTVTSRFAGALTCAAMLSHVRFRCVAASDQAWETCCKSAARPKPTELTMNPRDIATRIASMLAAVTVTAFLLGSQLGLAVHYGTDPLLAAAPAAAPVAGAPAGRRA
jgi:hypothetical protein